MCCSSFTIISFIHLAFQDLKPENIGLSPLPDGKFWLKLLDFGSGRAQTNAQHTQNVTTLHYRSPEAILSLYNENTRCGYGGKIFACLSVFFSHFARHLVDIWAAGCIGVEMLIGQPLFGERNRTNQWEVIVSRMGRPSPAMVEAMNDFQREELTRLNPQNAVPFEHLVPDERFEGGTQQTQFYNSRFQRLHQLSPASARNLLLLLLQMDANERISAAHALKHDYLALWGTRGAVNVNSQPITIPADELQYETVDDWKGKPIELCA